MRRPTPLLLCLVLLFAGTSAPAPALPAKAKSKPPTLVLDAGGHMDRVVHTAFSADGQTLVTISRDSTVRFWDVTTGETRRLVRLWYPFLPFAGKVQTGSTVAGGFILGVAGETGSSFSLVVTGDKPAVAKFAGMELKEVVEKGKKKMVVIDGHGQAISALTFHFGGGLKILSADRSGEVWLWDLKANRKQMLGDRAKNRHRGVVLGAAFSPDGKYAVTGGADATASIWSVAEPKTRKVLSGFKGVVAAVAWSPDGKKVATASYDGSIRVWSPQGELEHLHADAGKSITFLAFTSDSRELVFARAVEGKGEACCVMDVGTGKVRVAFDRHTGYVQAGAVSPNGKHVASVGGLDNEIYIWELATGKVVHRLGARSKMAWSAAWSGDGKSIAWGNTPRWSVRASLANPLAPLERAFQLDELKLGNQVDAKVVLPQLETRTTELRPGKDRASVTVVRRGTNTVECRLAPPPGRGLPGQPKGAFRNILGLAALPGDRAVVGDAAGLHVYETRHGRRLWTYSGFEAQVWALSPSPDGRFVLAACADQVLRIFAVEENTTGGLGLSYEHVKGSNFPAITTLLPDGGAAVDGRLQLGDRLVAVEDEDGKFVEFSDPAQPKGVNLGENKDAFSKWIGDLFGHREKLTKLLQGTPGSTVRLKVQQAGKNETVVYGLRRRQEVLGPRHAAPLVSLFVAGDEWVLWTEGGYYACSPGGERLIAWQIDEGEDKLPSVFPAAQFRKSLYQPEILRRVLQMGSVERAVAAVDKASGKTVPRTSVGEALPPLVVITSPARSGLKTSEETFEVAAVATSQGKHPVTGLQLLIDGRLYTGSGATKRIFTPKPGEVRVNWRVKLPAGRYRLQVLADSAVSQGTSTGVDFVVSREVKQRPRLFVVAIGISAYKEAKLKLSYGSSDAQALAKAFKDHSTTLFGEPKVKLVLDKDATRDGILDALEWVAKEMRSQDYCIFFFSGHGKKERGSLFFLPQDVDSSKLLRTAVPASTLKETLTSIKGKVILALDACHSGGIEDGTKGDTLAQDLADELVTEESGLILFCACRSQEVAKEDHKLRSGRFTHALIEGLSGKARKATNGAIYLTALEDYVSERVKKLSNNEQKPFLKKPERIQNFPLSKP